MDPNAIAAKLLCSISNTLPLDPVVANDGLIYERSIITDDRDVHASPQIKEVIELLVSSGSVDEKYLFLRLKADAESGDVVSMVELGELYLRGDGTDKDEEEGYKWFSKASEKDSGLGTSRKADCLIAGMGVQRDVTQAHRILVESAGEHKDPVPALARLWCLYSERVQGFERQESKAPKKLAKLKEKCPGLDDADLQRMKLDILEKIRPAVPLTACSLPVDELEYDNTVDYSEDVSTIGGVFDEQAPSQEESEPIGRMPTVQEISPEGDSDEDKASIPVVGAEVTAPSASHSTPSDLTKHDDSASESHGFESSEAERGMPVATAKQEDSVNERTSDGGRNQDNVDAEESNDGDSSSSTPVGTTSEKESPSPSPSGTVCKQCAACNHFKPSDAFSASQWKEAPGKCTACFTPKGAKTAEKGLSQPISATSAHRKACAECGQSKPQRDFTASQWKRRVGTGRCTQCVSTCIQWQSGSVASSLQTKACAGCGTSKTHADFSPNQWRKGAGIGRCKDCVQKSSAS